MKKHKFAAAGAIAIAAGMILHHGSAGADALDAIKARGTLIVGTKADYRPFGFRDASGAIVGFEPDLAKDVANKLGVKLELVPVVASNRISLLTEGKLDLVIATMNVTPERRKLVDFIEPAYYASGVNALALKSQHLHVWQQLRGKPVCMIEGAFYNAEIEQRYAPNSFPSSPRTTSTALSSRGLALPSPMTTPPSSDNFKIRNGRTMRCRSRRSWSSPGAWRSGSARRASSRCCPT